MLLLNGAGINKSFSGETLFENVSFNVYDICQKSREAKIGYLEQHPVSDSSRTVMEEILTVFSEVTAVEEQLTPSTE